MSFRKFSGLVLTTISSYTLFVEYNEISRRKEKKMTWMPALTSKVTSSSPAMIQNSTDDMIFDNLNTGDIILFRRKWYCYHIPTALVILLSQTFQKYEYDHCGVIVQDKYGVPFIFENTPRLGYRLSRLDERIHFSKSSQITVIPMLPRLKFNSKKVLTTNICQTIENLKDRGNNEVFDYFKSFLFSNYVRFHVIKSPPIESNSDLSTDSKNNKSDPNVEYVSFTIHPNALPVFQFYLALNIYPENFINSKNDIQNRNSQRNVFSIKSLANSNVSFVHSGTVEFNTNLIEDSNVPTSQTSINNRLPQLASPSHMLSAESLAQCTSRLYSASSSNTNNSLTSSINNRNGVKTISTPEQNQCGNATNTTVQKEHIELKSQLKGEKLSNVLTMSLGPHIVLRTD